jgi:hypothetical protein
MKNFFCHKKLTTKVEVELTIYKKKILAQSVENYKVNFISLIVISFIFHKITNFHSGIQFSPADIMEN